VKHAGGQTGITFPLPIHFTQFV